MELMSRRESANPRRWWLLGLALLFAITVYRVANIEHTYMREDEEIAFRTTASTLEYTIRYQAENDVHAPLWFASFWLWQQFAGSFEFTGRVYSIFLSAITLALMYQLARRWFGAARYGVFAVAAVGVNAYTYIYAMEIRPYALVMLVATVNMLLFHRWLTRQSVRAALAYGVSVALMMWIHYFLAFLVAAQVVYLLLSRRLFSRRVFRQSVLSALAALLLWLPWLPVFISQVSALKRIESASGDVRGLAGIGSTTEPTSLEAVLGLANVATNGLPLLYAVVLIVGVALLWRRTGYRLALAWALLVPAINLTVNLVASVYTQRYQSYISLGVALAAGAALAALPSRGRWLALAGFAIVSLWMLPSQLPFHIPHRYIFQTVAENAKPGDVIYFEEADESDKLVRWQIDHYLPAELRAREVRNERVAAQSRGIWFVTKRFLRPEIQDIFRNLERNHPLQMVVGDCNPQWCYLAQRLEGTPWQRPLRFGEHMAFWGADIDSIAPDRMDVRLWWRVSQPPPFDYSIGIHLLDAAGNLVAQDDGAIHHYDTVVQTSSMEADKIYIDSRSILPPVPLPSGDYRLVLVVYQSWDNVRLTLPDGSDTLEIGTITLS